MRAGELGGSRYLGLLHKPSGYTFSEVPGLNYIAFWAADHNRIKAKPRHSPASPAPPPIVGSGGPRYNRPVDCPECDRLAAELDLRKREHVDACAFLVNLAISNKSPMYQRIRTTINDCAIDVRLVEREIEKHDHLHADTA
jgi:hypothetical protein